MTRSLRFALALTALSFAPAAAQPDGFPHPEHERVFPLCTSCHEVADETRLYPAPASCTRCHDGQRRERVGWDGPEPRATLLRFDHVAHERAAAGENLTCGSCHVPAGGGRMDVIRADAPQCLDCHAHRAEAHLVDAECSTCHLPLATALLPVDRIVALPAPPDHARPDFLLAHRGGAECQYCHTRERCIDCHVDAASVRAIAALPAAPPAMELPVWTAHYPEPPSHHEPDWLVRHGRAASVSACSTCHTRDDCAACHATAAPAPIPSLPAAAEVVAPGVQLARAEPESHRIVDFEEHHGPLAATQSSTCTACHATTECTACHDAARGPSFHPRNFMEEHAASAWASRLECSNCHDAANFCADCHVTSGLTPEQVGSARYHDAEPVWLLRHGQAARQGLESCVACHRQQSCLRCHSELGAFRVNPHGRGFDAERARARNPFVCRACHVRDPVGRTP